MAKEGQEADWEALRPPAKPWRGSPTVALNRGALTAVPGARSPVVSLESRFGSLLRAQVPDLIFRGFQFFGVDLIGLCASVPMPRAPRRTQPPEQNRRNEQDRKQQTHEGLTAALSPMR